MIILLLNFCFKLVLTHIKIVGFKISYWLEDEQTQAAAQKQPKAVKPEEVSQLLETRARKTKEQRLEEKNSKPFTQAFQFLLLFSHFRICSSALIPELKEAEEKRREHQRQLEERKKQEALNRFNKLAKKENTKFEITKIEAYSDASKFPKEVEKNKVKKK